MRYLITGLGVAAMAMLSVTPAAAQPALDPRVPDIEVGHCPGGGMGSLIALGYCDGLPYPDGSFWHTVQYGSPILLHPYVLTPPRLQCVGGGGPIPEPAPPGGCGGAVPATPSLS